MKHEAFYSVISRDFIALYDIAMRNSVLCLNRISYDCISRSLGARVIPERNELRKLSTASYHMVDVCYVVEIQHSTNFVRCFEFFIRSIIRSEHDLLAAQSCFLCKEKLRKR